MKSVLRKVRTSLKQKVTQGLQKAQFKVNKTVKRKSGPSEIKVAVERFPDEVVVAESKFYPPSKPENKHQHYHPTRELPLGYGRDRIILQVRDPWWIHAYWEVTESAWERLRREYPRELANGFKKVLRVYDVSYIVFNGKNAHRFFDIEITSDGNNWYIDTQGPGRSWCVDFGLLFKNGRFITVLRSNTVSTPLAGPSWITDEEWMIPDDMFARLYGMGVGMGSSPAKLEKLWKERLKREFASGALFSVASPVKKEKLKGFWLVANTELIVYGQTEPDATLTVGGKPVKLRADGSFSLRFFLPDGKQIIPIIATSSDGEQVRSITPVVTKETK